MWGPGPLTSRPNLHEAMASQLPGLAADWGPSDGAAGSATRVCRCPGSRRNLWAGMGSEPCRPGPSVPRPLPRPLPAALGTPLPHPEGVSFPAWWNESHTREDCCSCHCFFSRPDKVSAPSRHHLSLRQPKGGRARGRRFTGSGEPMCGPRPTRWTPPPCRLGL